MVSVTAFLMQLVFPLEKAHMGGKVVLSAWSHAIPIHSQATIGLNLRQQTSNTGAGITPRPSDQCMKQKA